MSHHDTFAIDLYRQLGAEGGNCFFSPYSVATALAMVYGGARGETARQIADALHLSSDATKVHSAFRLWHATLEQIERRGHIRLHTANALWPETTHAFLEEYLNLVRTYYGVEVTPVDFQDPAATAALINAWIAEKTAGRITNMVPPNLDPLTRLILSNAIYFKGHWAHPFKAKDTEPLPFHITPNETIRVSTMKQVGKFRYGETDDVQILQLHYAGGDLSMQIVLPRARDGLERVENLLSPTTLSEWLGSLRTTASVHLYLPRFTVASTFILNEALAQLGITDAFKFGKANFSGFDGTGWFFIGQALHKAFVEVNEEGTEAAAATVMYAVLGSAQSPPEPTVFRADHPFLFFISDYETDKILFMGRVENPAENGA